MTGKTIEISLHALMVKESGREGSDTAINLANFYLHYPRSGASKLTSVKSLKLTDKQRKEFNEEDYQKRVVFKEEVVGRCQLVVELLAVRKVSKFEQFLGSIFNGVFTSFLGTLTGAGGAITNIIASSTVDTVGEKISDSITSDDDETDVIGEASYEINAETLEAGQIELDLICEKGVTYTEVRKRHIAGRDRIHSQKETLIEPKAQNGSLVLNIAVL